MLRAKIRKLGVAAAVSAAIGIGSLAGPAAHAVNLADDGLGEVALFQYYTVRNGWQTFFRIINTSDDVVPVKVRFRRATDSEDVLDFTVALSPKDMWVAWTDANADGNGNPGLVTQDASCLAPEPQFGGNGWVYAGDTPFAPDEPTDYRKYVTFKSGSAALEGHVEVISLGRSNPLLQTDPIVTDVVHGANDLPVNCTPFSNAFSPDPGTPAPEDLVENLGLLTRVGLNFLEPNNVLKANGYLFKAVAGQGAGYDPVMLANFYNPLQIDDSVPAAGGELIQQLFDLQTGQPFVLSEFKNILIAATVDQARPNLNDAFPRVSSVQVDTPFSLLGLLGNLLIGNNLLDPVSGPTTIVDEWNRGVDAVSAVLTRKSVVNEWAARQSPGQNVSLFQTEWALTFPTKHFYNTDAPPAIAPFDGPEVAAAFDIWDREENRVRCVSGIGQGTDCNPEDSLVNETNIITFGEDVLAGNYLGSEVKYNLPWNFLPQPLAGLPGRRHGWLDLEFVGPNAELGLGSDEEATQVYSKQEFGYNFGGLVGGLPEITGDIDPAGLCADPVAPPAPDLPDPDDIFAGGVPVAPPPAGVSGRLLNSLLLTGSFARPYIALPDATEEVEAGTCPFEYQGGALVCQELALADDNVTLEPGGTACPCPGDAFPFAWTEDASDPYGADGNIYTAGDCVPVLTDLASATNGVYRFENPLTYAGVPVIGFMFGLYNQGSMLANYAAIVDHSYRREVQLANGVCPATYVFGGNPFDFVFPPGWTCLGNGG
jgi:hypothetical protein